MKLCIKCGETGEFRSKQNGSGKWREGNICRSCESLDNMERAKYKRAVISRYKRMKGCKACGEKRPLCLDLDHRDPKEKKFTVGSNLGNKGMRTIAKEISKCDVLCANCHRIKTHENSDLSDTNVNPRLKATYQRRKDIRI